MTRQPTLESALRRIVSAVGKSEPVLDVHSDWEKGYLRACQCLDFEIMSIRAEARAAKRMVCCKNCVRHEYSVCPNFMSTKAKPCAKFAQRGKDTKETI